MAAIGKLFNPSFYTQSWAGVARRSHAYYGPMIRDNSITPLWHAMLAISVIAYTGNCVSRIYPEVQVKRGQKTVAMEEYYAKHGGAPH